MASPSNNKIVEECNRKLETLQKRKEEIEKEIRETEALRDAAESEEQWAKVSEELKALRDTDFSSLQKSLQEAVEAFNKSLHAPPGYDKEAVVEDGYVIPYCDTDNYADLSAFDGVVEEETSEFQEQLAAVAHTIKKDEDANTKKRRNLVLRLLFLTLHIGRIETITDFDLISDEAERPFSDVNELKEEVAAQWQWLLYQDTHVLSSQEREEWRSVVTTFLGPPFDAVA
ncbi:hypothetical protein ADEAN_000604000 [Angomonas deanei]|uniref:Uncharacterized protein n=1 Tax=Angomonas deanei TaxID=59799 RepID=A0A7G2CHV8_9TRYP|nr:hypothetical protein ADEAN_000604000 [Angomonas deanei]